METQVIEASSTGLCGRESLKSVCLWSSECSEQLGLVTGVVGMAPTVLHGLVSCGHADEDASLGSCWMDLKEEGFRSVASSLSL